MERQMVVKRGGEQACEIRAGLGWALEQVKNNAGSKVTLVLSAPRAARGSSAQTTDLLNAMAEDLDAQTPRVDRALQRLETIRKFVAALPDVQSSETLQAELLDWRQELLCLLKRAETNAPSVEREGCDHRVRFEGEEPLSLTALGEDLSVRLHRAALAELGTAYTDRINFQSGYTPETAGRRGYSDLTAAGLAMGNELHVHKPFAVHTADPNGHEMAELLPEIRGQAAIEQALGSEGFARGVLQEDAVRLLLDSDRTTTVFIYNPARPEAVTRVHFEAARALAA